VPERGIAMAKSKKKTFRVLGAEDAHAPSTLPTADLIMARLAARAATKANPKKVTGSYRGAEVAVGVVR